MNRESITCRRVNFGEMEKVGDFSFADNLKHINIWLPGQLSPDAIQITTDKGRNEPRIWFWDGNQEQPTITPSIHLVGHWHGHLTAGKLISV